MGPEHQAPTDLLKKYLGRHRVCGPTRRRATKEGSKVINRNWVNYNVCSLSYYIYVVPNLYMSKNDFMKLSAKIFASIYFSEFIY